MEAEGNPVYITLRDKFTLARPKVHLNLGCSFNTSQEDKEISERQMWLVGELGRLQSALKNMNINRLKKVTLRLFLL